MIEPGKLFQLAGGQRRRKLALTFGALERDILGIAEKDAEYHFASMSRQEYIKRLTEILLTDTALPEDARSELSALLKTSPLDEHRICNVARNHLLKIIGTFPAEWDLIIAPHANPYNEDGSVVKRTFFEGVCAYAEDIRSPFNLGSIFRTAEALGAEKLYLSKGCTPPTHARAIRSAMGCIETLPHEITTLENLPNDVPIFALETGGTPIAKFKFPEKGICLIGSEELGLSPAALARATYGTVSIPMNGLKASLNVGVAFGILLQKWVESIQ